MIEILHYLKDPEIWDYGVFLIMDTAGFISSTVVPFLSYPMIPCIFRIQGYGHTGGVEAAKKASGID